jgi:hypothetical protein
MKDYPKFFYRYYRFDQFTERIFTKNEIYFQQPSKFNDLLDSRIAYTRGATIEEECKFLERNLPLAMPELTEREINQISKDPSKVEKFFYDFCKKQDKRRDELGVYCLTTLRDNILMWAHYSDYHKGFCLEFDGKDEFFQKALPITYLKELPTFNIWDNKIGNFHKYTEELADLLLIKAEDWKYENEWRIVYTPKQGGPSVHTFPEKLLTGVIFGFRISRENRNNIIEWCKGRTIKPKMYQSTPKNRVFGVGIVPFEDN